MSLPENRLTVLLGKPWRQYLAAFVCVGSVSLLNVWLQRWTGYEALALVYLLAVVVLALFVGRGPIIFGATLTALAWNFLFVPPRFSLHIAGFYDRMMLLTYFVVAITVGQLTARLRTQREAEVKAKLLVESERLGRALLNSVSHELGTPIAAIISASGGLRTAGPLSEAQNRLLNEIEVAGARLHGTVRELLSAARLQSGLVRPKLDWCDVGDLVRAVRSETAELTNRHEVETKIASGLPLVRMDFMLMEQALTNLVSNVAVHTPPRTRLEISARLDGKELLLEVADNGPGLAPGEAGRVFDIFHRSPDARPGGTGLGLAIVKGFVEAQGGSVEAANRTQGGALFSIRLPAGVPPVVPEETP
jgi:two-component system sensor histidine kinase KdpD